MCSWLWLVHWQLIANEHVRNSWVGDIILILCSQELLYKFKSELNQNSMQPAAWILEESYLNMPIAQVKNYLRPIGGKTSQLQEQAEFNSVAVMTKLLPSCHNGGFNCFCQVLNVHDWLLMTPFLQSVLLGKSPNNLKLSAAAIYPWNPGSRHPLSLMVIHTQCIWWVVTGLILLPVALSCTRQNTFQKVSNELFVLMPCSCCPPLSQHRFSIHSRKICRDPMDRVI